MGYALAVYNYEPQKIKKLTRKFRKKQVGAVKRPTAQELKRKGTLQEETEKAMDKTFKKIL